MKKMWNGSCLVLSLLNMQKYINKECKVDITVRNTLTSLGSLQMLPYTCHIHDQSKELS